ncbi:MAG: hypothetical protein JRK53_09580, partial [Deltaproteobacteria bacterium]|nr:hypothetical protein [Deltaproteobacteria bacterium]
IPQGDPSVIVTAAFHKNPTDALDQPVAVFFFDHQPIDIPRRAQYQVQAFQFVPAIFQLNTSMPSQVKISDEKTVSQMAWFSKANSSSFRKSEAIHAGTTLPT